MYCRFMYVINVISRRQRNGYIMGEGWFSNCEMGTPYLFLSPACAHVLDVVGIRAACLFYIRY